MGNHKANAGGAWAINSNRNLEFGAVAELDAPSPKTFMIITLISIMCVLAFVYKGMYTKHLQVVGQIKSTSKPTVVRAPADGQIMEMPVKEGNKIQGGAKIAAVEINIFVPGGQKYSGLQNEGIESNYRSLGVKKDRIMAKRQVIQEKFKIAMEDVELQRRSAEKIISNLEQQKRIASKRHAKLKKLYAQKVVSRLTVETSASGVTAIDAKLSQERQRLQSLEALRINVRSSTDQEYRSVREASEGIALEKSEIDKRRLLVKLENSVEVRAPHAGEVQGLAVKFGDFVRTGDKLFTIKAEKASLRADLFVPSSSLPFIRKGRPVDLSVEAFPVEKYGTFKGKIKSIDAKPLSQEEMAALGISEISYRVTVEIDKPGYRSSKENYDFREGMIVSSNLQLSSRTIFDWLTEVLQRIWLSSAS